MNNPYLRKLYIPALFILFIAVSTGCKKSSSTTTTTGVVLPTIATSELIINLTTTTAQSGGVVSSGGNDTLRAQGVCYSTTNKTPSTSDSKTTVTLTNSSAIPYTFVCPLSGLTPNTAYYVRAYATNSKGTAYGDVVTFTTSSSISAVTGNVTTIAGSGAAGYTDGTGTNALFNNPQGITTDAAGNIYVADSYNNIIRKITPAGVVTTLAGDGTIGNGNGGALTSQFYGPDGLFADARQNIFVADFGNNVIRELTSVGAVSTFAGTGEAGYTDGASNIALFNNPAAVAVDASGNMYVADKGNNLIRKITSAGVVSTFAGTKTAGYVNATGTAASFSQPNALAVDAAGNVYVADLGNSAIRKITAAGVVTTIAGGPSQISLIDYPAGIALDKKGNIFIADEGGRIIECTTTNVLYILAGKDGVSGFTDGTGSTALFNNPQGITVDANGNIYVADKSNNAIRKIVVTVTQ